MTLAFGNLPVRGHYLRKRLRLAGFARWLGLFAIVLVVAGFTVLRLGGIEPRALAGLLILSAAMATLGLVIAVWGLARVWFGGVLGGGKVSAAFVLSLVALAPFLFAAWLAVENPRANVAYSEGMEPDAVAAVIAQPESVASVATGCELPDRLQDAPGVAWLLESYSAITNSMFGSIDLAAELTAEELTAQDNKNLDSLTANGRGRVFASDLLSAGGMNGMLNTIWLIICAMCFGGVMEACGIIPVNLTPR